MKKFAMLLKDDKRMRQFVKTLVGPDCNSQKAQELVVRLGHIIQSFVDVCYQYWNETVKLSENYIGEK